MYHPTSRVLTVLELLQSQGRISGPQLAARLEVDVRTVRRYIATLQDLGIPIDAETGRHGCYVLRPGFKLPPLLFTNDEAIAITLGMLVLQQVGLDAAAPAVAGALAKLERLLPATSRAYVEALRSTLTFDAGTAHPTAWSGVIAAASLAAQTHRQLWLRYAGREAPTERLIDPYGVVCHDRSWYVVGFCHLREDVRIFRLDRVLAVALRESTFVPPGAFAPLEYVLRSFALIPDRWNVLVLLDATPEHARQQLPASLAILEPAQRGVWLRASINDLDMIARSLITLGCPFVVHEPPELRATLRRIAADTARMAEAVP